MGTNQFYVYLFGNYKWNSFRHGVGRTAHVFLNKKIWDQIPVLFLLCFQYFRLVDVYFYGAFCGSFYNFCFYKH